MHNERSAPDFHWIFIEPFKFYRSNDDVCEIQTIRSKVRNMSPTSMTTPLTGTRDNEEDAVSLHEVKKVIIQPCGYTFIEGKHIAKRNASQWIYYGDPKIWDIEFEGAVRAAVDSIKRGALKSSGIIEHFEKIRHEIAGKRRELKVNEFGLRRDIQTNREWNKSYWTKMYRSHGAYGYALERAVKIPYDGKHFINTKSEDGIFWERYNFYGRGAMGSLRYGLVQGFIGCKPIPLTQYIFCSRTDDHRRVESEDWFGRSDHDYIGDNKESAIWLHTGREQIPVVLEHIKELIEKAISGDLSVIPRIHWWYVHLAPTSRGSGGIAEMVTNTLCRLHEIDLPPWREGVAPSVEVLLQPNEERFCSDYYQLFALDREKLKALFKAPE